jgi:ATP-dependent RNA helicase SUPV3L1/SUV3
VTQASPTKTHDTQALDTLTGGAFTAPTSGERAARVRDWLAGNPSPEQMQEVFRELSGRDKGAARLLRERLDEIKRSKGQEVLAAEWAEKARALMAPPKINIADALAWQRDAARH